MKSSHAASKKYRVPPPRGYALEARGNMIVIKLTLADRQQPRSIIAAGDAENDGLGVEEFYVNVFPSPKWQAATRISLTLGSLDVVMAMMQ